MAAEPNNLLVLRDAKQRARELLGQRFAEGLIDDDELERRLESVEQADTLGALDQLVVDIIEPHASARAFLVPHTPASTSALVDPRAIQEHRELAVAFSATTRSGPWMPARHTEVVVVFGELTLDFRKARLGLGVTTIELRGGCSSMQMIVPPGLAVSVDVSVLLGSLVRDPEIPELPIGADQPSLFVTGRIVLASVEIRVAKPV